MNISNSLIDYMKNYEENVSSIDFKNRCIPKEYRDEFEEKIVDKYPNTFIKDTELIKNKLKYKTITFGKDVVKITVVSELFEENVELIKNDQQLNYLQITNSYTVVKIMGQPFES